MSRRDLVGMIADARAQMMMRGHEHLKIAIGEATLKAVMRSMYNSGAGLDDREWDGPLLGMPLTVRSDMEGFLIEAISD